MRASRREMEMRAVAEIVRRRSAGHLHGRELLDAILLEVIQRGLCAATLELAYGSGYLSRLVWETANVEWLKKGRESSRPTSKRGR